MQSDYLSMLLAAAVAFPAGRPTEPHFNPSHISDDDPTSPPPPQMSRAHRGFFALFISGWLLAWTAAMVMVTGSFLTSLWNPSFETAFMAGWLCAATAGWFLAVGELRSLLGSKNPRPPFDLFRRN